MATRLRATGNSIVVDDRDTLGGELTARIGYFVSPALIPSLEASVGRENYDQRIDNTGSERSSTTYGARAGAEFNFGEKKALGRACRRLCPAIH